MEAKVKRTTYVVDGFVEPCFEVTNGYTLVRIAPCYHSIDKDTIIITEFLGGEFNAEDEWDYEYDYLDCKDALCLAKRYSIYL